MVNYQRKATSLQFYFTDSLKRTQNCLIFCEFVTCQMTAPDPREVRDLHSRYRLSLKNSLSDHFTSRLLICGILYDQRYEIVAHYIHLKNALMHSSFHLMVNVYLCYRVVFEIALPGDIYYCSQDMLCILQ